MNRKQSMLILLQEFQQAQHFQLTLKYRIIAPLHINLIGMASEAIFDICLTVGSIRNITTEWTPRFSFNINFQVPTCEDYPCPYLVTEPNKNWHSSTDLQSYKSDSVILAPLQQKSIKQICVFKASVPLIQLEEIQLSCFIEFYIDGRCIGTAKFCYVACAGICSFLPIYSPTLGITISMKVQTQMLGIRGHKKFQEDSIVDIKKAIEGLFYQGNRLTHKIKMLQNSKQDNKTVESISYIESLQQKQNQQQTNQLSQQYLKFKLFKPSRIFKNKLSKEEHKDDVVHFVEKVRSQYMVKLQIDWQKYLKISEVDCLGHIEELRKRFVEDFALEIKNKIIRNKGLHNCSLCPVTVGQLRAKIDGFQILQIEGNSQTKVNKRQSFYEGKNHLVVLVHGYGANNLAMAYIERTIRYLYSHIDILNSKSNQTEQENTNIEAMGHNLAIEIEEAIKQFNYSDEFQISFIGHSLGGLVIRAALVHLQVFKENMNCYISLATPHLGHILHKNKIAKYGINLLNSLRKSNVIDTLFLKDAKDERLSLLYSLSMHSGLSWFKAVSLFGGEDDGYVSADSALIDSRGYEYSGMTHEVYMEMARNLNEYICKTRLTKINTKFNQEDDPPNLSELLLGKSSHMSFVCHQSFINFILLHNYPNFKQNEPQILEYSY